MGDSSSDSDEYKNLKDVSIIAIKDSDDAFDSLFAFMTKSKDEEKTLLDIKQDLNNYSLRKLGV